VAKGDFDRAIQDFNEATRLQPDAAEIFLIAGQPMKAKVTPASANRKRGETNAETATMKGPCRTMQKVFA